jgi:hypothetical protein
MGNQRIETRSALGFEDAGNRLPVGRVAGEAVDGLGRNGHNLAGFEQSQRRFQSFGCGYDVSHGHNLF